jgi:hypothetical protein
MTEPIQIDPAAMRDVANQHDEVADTIAAARATSAEILAAVNSYGPIMYQVKAATAELLADRDTALALHEQTHRHTAVGLRREATNFVGQDEINAERLRLE